MDRMPNLLDTNTTKTLNEKHGGEGEQFSFPYKVYKFTYYRKCKEIEFKIIYQLFFYLVLKSKPSN